MKPGNVVDILSYREETEPQDGHFISEELKTAIQNLIIRLRELGPISK